MDGEILTILSQLGFGGAILYVFIKQTAEREQYERKRSERRDSADKIIENNTTAINNNSILLEKNLVTQSELVKDILELKIALESHNRQGEKIFTEIVTNNKVSSTKLDAIIREAFDKRTGEIIKEEIKEVEKVAENEKENAKQMLQE